MTYNCQDIRCIIKRWLPNTNSIPHGANKKMKSCRKELRFVKSIGADIVGFGDISELPDNVRSSMPIGISVAVLYPREIIRGISELPTQEYRDWYDKLNERLDSIVANGAELSATYIGD